MSNLTRAGRVVAGAILVVSLAWPGRSRAELQVWLDYTNFSTRMSELATSAGVTQFTADETALIKAGILNILHTSYAGYTVTFTETAPTGSYATIGFGQTASAGTYGQAQHIDYRNQVISDTCQIYSANFDFIIDEFDGSTSRATQISQLSTAIGGTAAHEFAHNLGLRHHDAYGMLTYTGTAVSAGGLQNTEIMATGSTGLGELGRETVRTFAVLSKVKLGFAAELSTNVPGSTLESGDAGNTWATAQTITLGAVPNVDRIAANVIGSLSAGDIDYYRLDLRAGQTELTLDVNTEMLTSASDTLIKLYDSLGNTLYTNDDTYYSTTQFGAGTQRTTDSILLNIPIATPGTYYVSVQDFAGSAGDYELLLFAVPEPGVLISLAGLGGMAGIWWWRRRERQGPSRLGQRQ